MNEFEIIRRYFTRAPVDPDVLIGPGDDAAVLQVSGRVAMTVDTLVEGVHFPPGTAAEALGHRALAVNLSDLAAVGARPRWCMMALTLAEPAPEWLDAFAGGFFALAERFGAELIGGNLTRGPLAVTVTAIGSLGEHEPLKRDGGQPGDDVYVTGTLGDAAAGLALLEQGGAAGAGRVLVERFLRPEPRVAAGLALAGLASAAIDVSDGLAADLGHLCEASGCGAAVDVDRLPLSPALETLRPRDALELALTGGDDYELCFTAAPEQAAPVAAAMKAAGVPCRLIGRLAGSREIVWRRRGEPVSPGRRGYLHF